MDTTLWRLTIALCALAWLAWALIAMLVIIGCASQCSSDRSMACMTVDQLERELAK